MQEVAMSVQTFMEVRTQNRSISAKPNRGSVMRKSLSMLGLVLLPGFLVAGAPQASAFTITQLSNQSVGSPPGPATACVDVAGASTANGTLIGPFPCNNQFNEQWIYQNGQFLGLGTVGFGAAAVNKCLSVHGNSTVPGAGVELDTCAGGGGQLWLVEGVVSLAGNHSTIENLATGFCLDSKGAIGAGLQLVVEPCNGSAGQQWDLK
jgi:Ricin-type beta-trefoil lectin domain-like